MIAGAQAPTCPQERAEVREENPPSRRVFFCPKAAGRMQICPHRQAQARSQTPGIRRTRDPKQSPPNGGPCQT